MADKIRKLAATAARRKQGFRYQNTDDIVERIDKLSDDDVYSLAPARILELGANRPTASSDTDDWMLFESSLNQLDRDGVLRDWASGVLTLAMRAKAA